MSIYTEESVQDVYKKLEHRDHVLELPDTYIGSVEDQENELWVINDSTDCPVMEKRNVSWTPGLLNIFTEILVNSTDHHTRVEGLKRKNIHKVTTIDVIINQEENLISIRNNGEAR